MNEARDAAIAEAREQRVQDSYVATWNAAVAHTRGEVIDEFVRRIYAKHPYMADNAELPIINAIQAVAAEMKEEK